MRSDVALTLLAVLFAGCLGGTDPGREAPGEPPVAPAPGFVKTATGTKATNELTARDAVEAPVWEVGDWFGVHVHLPSGDPAGRHYETVVVDDADGYLLAATDPTTAKEEAVLDLPVAGVVDPRHLATSAYGLDWDLFRFPLTDNKTWDAPALVRDLTTWTVHDFVVTFTAAFDPQIDVQGTRHPGFVIEGRTAEGDLMFEHDYVPALGWFAHLTVHNILTEDPGDAWFRAVSMGHGKGWTGTYYVDNAELLVQHWTTTSPLAGPQPAPTLFEVPAGVETVHAFMGAFAWNGAERLIVTDPTGATHERTAAHAGVDDAGDADHGYVDLPNLPGTWTVVGIGAGAFAGALTVVWALAHESGALPPTQDA